MRLIDANALSDLIWRSSRSAIQDVIQNAPTIEAERIQHGHWIDHTYKYRYPIGRYECSICGAAHEMEWGYCPTCGAKMDEEVEQ